MLVLFSQQVPCCDGFFAEVCGISLRFCFFLCGGVFLTFFGGLGRPGALWLPSRLKSLIFQYFGVQIGAFWDPRGGIINHVGCGHMEGAQLLVAAQA